MRKSLKFLFFVFLGIVIITTVKTTFFSEWTFTNRLNYNLFWSFHYSSCVLSFFSFLILFLRNKSLKIICGVLGLVISYFIFDIQFNPIDTNKYPIDKKILSQNGNEKIIVREKNKGKSLAVINDTIKAKDVWIFRKIY
ncbi:MAG: hypothetical protein QM564_00710 [Bergeyella sp.]